ncbi:MAG: C-type lectin domain-containing protein [Phycisphaerae bacterium]|nr:C-type lectin domain-containing protein [Phycisphaerae bacterium]
MKLRFFFICVCGLVWSAVLPCYAAQPWLGAVGDRTVVCCSPKADALVRRAAERVLAELRKVRPGAILLDPDALATDYATLDANHVICVGQWGDNQVLRMTWGYWANSREERDWKSKGERRAIELTDLWKKEIPAQAWRWQHDFFAFGYGDFDGADVGYVQTVRNPFPILLRTVPGQTVYNTRIPRPFDDSPANQMYFITDLTGTGPAGVVKAVEVFLKDGVLNGVVPGAGRQLPDDWSLEGLGPKQLATDLPAWAPVADLPAGVQYLGQQMPGSHLYGGFYEASGIRPQRLWRLKYRVAEGFRFFDSYPTNRASGNELLIATCASADEAKAAAKAFVKNLSPEPQTVVWEFGGHSYAVYGASFKGWLTWDQSRNFCEKLGGHLITLSSQGEQDALGKALDRASTPTTFLGLSGDWRTNQWSWVTGEPMSFRAWRTKNGKELYGQKNKKGKISPPEKIPGGPIHPVRFTIEPDPGWYLAESGEIDAFVCEWDKPGAAPHQSSSRTRVTARGRYVLMESFDDLAGESILRKGTEQ